MELIVEFVLSVLGDLCCQACLALVADSVFTVSAVKLSQARAREKETGDPSDSGVWVWLFWLLLPVVVGLTGLLLYTLARRGAG